LSEGTRRVESSIRGKKDHTTEMVIYAMREQIMQIALDRGRRRKMNTTTTRSLGNVCIVCIVAAIVAVSVISLAVLAWVISL
jgi:hypothetical protein